MSNQIKDSTVKEQLTPAASEKKLTIIDELIRLAQANCELFTDADETSYATLTGSKKERQTHAISSRSFRRVLGHWFYRSNAKPARKESITEAVEALASIAAYSDESHPVFIRTAQANDHYYIDLCNDLWQVVEVGSDGYRVLNQSPVKFIRTQSMRALPEPTQGGSIDDFWHFVNVPASDRLLLLAFMVEALRADTQKPILEILGGHGTGKSLTTHMIRALLDPNKAMLRALPKSIDDLFVTASTNWVQTFENISHLPAPIQDAMCQISTGTGYAKRKLHTDMDEVAIALMKPQILNGITPLATRQDMADRTVRLSLTPLAPSKKIEDSQLKANFEATKSNLFGALLDVFSKALSILPDVRLEKPPRLADFGRLGEAVGRAINQPNQFCTQFFSNQKSLALTAIESSPAAMAVIALAENNVSNHIFTGSFKQLLTRLEPYKSHDFEGWPKSPRGLADILKRQESALTMAGINLQFLPRGRNGYPVVITLQPEQTRSSSSSSSGKPYHCEHHEHNEHPEAISEDDDEQTEAIL